MRLAAVAILLAVAACGTARRGAPVVAEKEITDPEVRRGEVVFFRNCNFCHPGGEAGIGPAINNKPLPEGIITTQVRQGLGMMPAFSAEEIGDPDLRAVAAYLRWLRGLQPTVEATSDE